MRKQFWWTVFVGILVFVLPLGQVSSDASEEPVHDLIGLWEAKRNFTPEVQGPITISEADGVLKAEISGFSIVTAAEDGKIRFEIPGDRGYFRGKFSDDKQEIRGHWVQPWVYSSFAEFASPVILGRNNDGFWTGTVAPLNDQLQFFLVIEEKEDGHLGAFIRNPEANIGRFYRIENVVREGNKVRFLDDEGQTRLEGTYNEDSGHLSIYFFFNGGTYDFVRADDDTSTAFYPRPGRAGAYDYAKPLPGGGWETASLEEVGLARAPIEDMIRMIVETPIERIDAPYIHSFLVARHGKLVLEEYFHGTSRDVPHATRSASKSVTTTLAGMAVQQNTLDLDTSVYEAMYNGEIPTDLDPRAGRMQLRHLITMTSGLDCNDSNYENPGNEDIMQEQEDQLDWHQYTLDLPMIHEPGTHAAYCSGGQNLAGGVVSKLSKKWLPTFFLDHFAEPLGIEKYHMNLTPVGEGYGGGGLYFKPRDFLKLGQLYLNDGQWNGEQLLPPGWAEAASTPYNKIRDEGYGYGWWVFSYPFEDREVKAYYAGGNGGQYVIIIPELDLNIVIMAGNFNQRVQHKPKYEYVRDYILPAVK